MELQTGKLCVQIWRDLMWNTEEYISGILHKDVDSDNDFHYYYYYDYYYCHCQ